MFRFTIRDVLWMMVVVGLTCAWLSSHSSVQKSIRNLEVQVHHFAAKLAIETDQGVYVSSESGGYVVTPVCARLSYGLPYPPPGKPPLNDTPQ